MNAVFTSALPLFALILCGYAAGRFGLMSEAALDGLNRFVFYFALPALLFFKLAATPFASEFDWRFLVVYTVASLLVFSAALAIGRVVFGSDLATAALQGAAASFSNIGYLGLPLIITAVGDSAALPGVLVLVVDNVVTLSLAAALVEAGIVRRSGSGLAAASKTLRGLVRHPLIVAIFAGIAAAAVGLPIPAPVAAFGDLLGGAAGPAALFALGVTLVGRPVTRRTGETGYLVLFKLVVHPATVWIAMTRVVALDPLWVTVAVVMSGMPTGANVFVLAQRYGVYVARASTVILLSTAASVVTVSTLLVLFAG